MTESVAELINRLYLKDNRIACAAAKALVDLAAISNAAYPYFDEFAAFLDDPNSLRRNRGLMLLASNAQWDVDNRFDRIIDRYLAHISDEKPITARQCIQRLPEIARYKPHLSARICQALTTANVSAYSHSMRPLIDKDIRVALDAVSAQPGQKS